VNKVSVILPAAGLGTRMGRSATSAGGLSGGVSGNSAETFGTSRKQFMLLDGSPILAHTVRKFLHSDRVGEIVVAVRADDVEWVTKLLKDVLRNEERSLPVRACAGGDSRQQSVENALESLAPDTELVVVHDAVRPFVDVETIDRAIEEARAHGAAIVALVPVDTVKQVTAAQATGAKVRGTLNRERLVLAQTPQVFQYEILKKAFAKAREDGFMGTDESSLVERLETVEISVVPGSERNIKITRLFLDQDHRRMAGREAGREHA
jgi:2-C-methyl-D-erythritol 4-phosphate cytidylyltransferase